MKGGFCLRFRGSAIGCLLFVDCVTHHGTGKHKSKVAHSLTTKEQTQSERPTKDWMVLTHSGQISFSIILIENTLADTTRSVLSQHPRCFSIQSSVQS